MAVPAIETRGLSKHYGDNAAVNNISFQVPAGKVVGFVGPNGAGKTTTIRMLLGLIRPTSGHARVLGHDIRRPTRFLPRVGALIESPAFYPGLSATANLEVFARLGGCDPKRVPWLLHHVGLTSRAEDPYRDYSLGMKQRLGIAAALLPDPDIVILDEPMNGLDPAGIREIRDFLRELGRQGKTVFVSSHILSEVQKTCDHVIVIRHGRIIFQGSMDAMLARSAALVVAAADRRHHRRLAAMCRKAGFEVEERDDDLLVQGAPPAAAAKLNRAAFKAGITLRELHALGDDLEQVFLAMTEGEAGL